MRRTHPPWPFSDHHTKSLVCLKADNKLQNSGGQDPQHGDFYGRCKSTRDVVNAHLTPLSLLVSACSAMKIQLIISPTLVYFLLVSQLVISGAVSMHTDESQHSRPISGDEH